MGGSLARLALVGVLVCASGPATLLADTLILKDGTQIVARGQAVVVDGEVGFFDRDGSIQRFRVDELDLQATKLTNLIANRKRAGQRPKYVIDDDNTRHSDPELYAVIQDCDDARSAAALALCTQRLMASADRLSANLTLKLRCKERFPNDWGAEALCKLGKEPPPG
ncbi:MAG TPA: hypothetical protein VFE33_34965, partial [Thermoanaerobaculia bacterium]|nr:hypothetical protein [Thermoanaerobaculia bacterium]